MMSADVGIMTAIDSQSATVISMKISLEFGFVIIAVNKSM